MTCKIHLTMLLDQTMPTEGQKGTTAINSKPVDTTSSILYSVTDAVKMLGPVQLVVGISVPLLMVSLTVLIVTTIMVVIWKSWKKSPVNHDLEQQGGSATFRSSNLSLVHTTSENIYEQFQLNSSTVPINPATVEYEPESNNYAMPHQVDSHPIYSTIDNERSYAHNGVTDLEVDHTPSQIATSAEVTYAVVDKSKKRKAKQMRKDEEDEETEPPPVPAYYPEESSVVEYEREEGIEEMYAVVNKNWRKAQEEETEKVEEEKTPPIPPYTVESLDTEVKMEPDGEHGDGKY